MSYLIIASVLAVLTSFVLFTALPWMIRGLLRMRRGEDPWDT